MCSPASMRAPRWGMGDKGAATWGHMKLSCSGVPVPSIQGVHSQLSQDWGGHLWDKVLWTPHCAETPHTHCTVSQPESIMQSIPSTCQAPSTPASIPTLSLPCPWSLPAPAPLTMWLLRVTLLV